MFRELFLASYLSFQPTWLEIGNAQSRCSLDGCLTEVTTTKPDLIKEVKRKFYTSVFYDEDEFYLHYELRRRIRDFLKEHPNDTNFVVTGFTDGCGSHSYNKELSRKRADEVARYVMSLRRNALVRLEWKGEITGAHTIGARRVDVAVFKKSTYKTTPPKIVADFYLIDASGSMAGEKWEKWTQAISYWKPRHAKVYVSSTRYIPSWANLASIRPTGGTEIWFSYWSILDEMRAGQTLIIISDLKSNVPLSRSESSRIAQKARQKGVKVYFQNP